MKRLSDYSDEDKIKWFDEFYEMAEEYAKEDNKRNREVYECMFINSAKDVLDCNPPSRYYQFIGPVIVNTHAIEKGVIYGNKDTSQDIS